MNNSMGKVLSTNATPVDRVAARVMRKGVQYTPQKRIAEDERDAPFRLKKINAQIRGNPSFEDLTGARQGRLTVIGLSAEHNGKWCCRCDCGKYVPRSSKSIKNPENRGDRCQSCRHLSFLKREREWMVHGKHVDFRDC